MARASTALRRRLASLRSELSDPKTRYIDYLVEFVEVDRKHGGTVYETGRTAAYGWRFDKRAIDENGNIGAFCDDVPLDLEPFVLRCNPKQFDLVTDDDSYHLLCYGSRRSSKTETLVRFVAKILARHPRKALTIMVQKRRKGRKLLEEKILPQLPSRWLVPGKEGIRKSQDELAVLLGHGGRIDIISTRVPDDARGDGVVSAAIDETQLADPESRANLLLSISEGGDSFQTLETATLTEDFLDYLETAKANPRYRVEELSVTDNIHLDTVYDEVTDWYIPSFVISARSVMDPKLFAQEIGVWDAEQKRFHPVARRATGRVYWPYKASEHRREYSPAAARKVVQHITQSIERGVGEDITAEVMLDRFGGRYAGVIGTCLEQPLQVGLVARFFATPKGWPDLVWIVDEISLDDESSPQELAKLWRAKGYGNSGVVPDALGRRRAKGGVTGCQQIESQGFSIRGPARNPPLIDCDNIINGRLRNGNEQASLLIDPKCVGLHKALKDRKRTERGDPSIMDDHGEHYALALGYLLHFFTSLEDVRQLAASADG